MPAGKSFDNYLEEQFRRDPEFAEEWGETQLEGQIALALAHFREQKGMTQRDLARATGIAQPMIARIERAGQVPTVATFWKLLRGLDAVAEVGGPGRVVLRSAVPTGDQVLAGN